MKTRDFLTLLVALLLAGCSGEKKDSPPSQTATSQSATNQPATNQPAAGQTSDGQTSADRIAAGQGSTSQPAATDEGATPRAPDAEQAPVPARVRRTHPNRPAPDAEKPAPVAPTMVSRMISVGPSDSLVAVLDQKLSTETDRTGRSFTATLPDGFTRNGITILPAGSRVEGEISQASRAGRIGGKAGMTLEFRRLTTPDGKSYALVARPLALEGKSTTKGDVEKITGGTVGGAILGGILGGKKGLLKGGLIGGAAGTGWAASTRGNDIVLDPGAKLSVSLAQEISVPVTLRSDQPLP